jgi:hypothetical protein
LYPDADLSAAPAGVAVLLVPDVETAAEPVPDAPDEVWVIELAGTPVLLLTEPVPAVV